jgi:hypothetical protein
LVKKPEQSCWKAGKGILRLPIDVTVVNLVKLNLMEEWGETSTTSSAF